MRGLIAVLLSGVALAGCGALAPPTTPTLTPLQAQGRHLFESYCERCHTTSGSTVVVGPSLAGVARRGGARVAGLDAEGYLRQSIRNPGAYVVEGFPDGLMPTNFAEQMTSEELDALVAYVLTLE